MYATAAARSDGLLLLTGGRDVSGTPLADAFGLARHRDGRWEWASAPGTMPSPRYQHGAVFVGARLHIFGGAVGGGKMVDEASSVVVLDTAAGQWLTQAQAGHQDDVMRRCRHAMASVGPYIFVHGGLKGSTLLEDVLLADDSSGAELSVCDPRSPAWQQWINSMHGSEAAAAALANAAAEEAAAAAALSIRRVGNMEDLRCLDEDLDENMRLNKVGARAASVIGAFAAGGQLAGCVGICNCCCCLPSRLTQLLNSCLSDPAPAAARRRDALRQPQVGDAGAAAAGGVPSHPRHPHPRRAPLPPRRGGGPGRAGPAAGPSAPAVDRPV
jgi:hypothetical protein